MAITKKQINSEIITSREGRIFSHTYYTENGKYNLETSLFESASNRNRVTNEAGFCCSEILENKKEFVSWLYNELN